MNAVIATVPLGSCSPSSASSGYDITHVLLLILLLTARTSFNENHGYYLAHVWPRWFSAVALGPWAAATWRRRWWIHLHSAPVWCRFPPEFWGRAVSQDGAGKIRNKGTALHDCLGPALLMQMHRVSTIVDRVTCCLWTLQSITLESEAWSWKISQQQHGG